MSADDTVICNHSRQETPKRYRCLSNGGQPNKRPDTQRDPSGRVRPQGAEIKRVQAFGVNGPVQQRVWRRSEEGCVGTRTC